MGIFFKIALKKNYLCSWKSRLSNEDALFFPPGGDTTEAN